MKKFVNFITTDFSTKKFIPISLKKNSLIIKPFRGLCTVSSGQDSTLAFFLLLHIQEKDSLQILYCNHFWQIKNLVSIRELYQVSYFSKISYTVIFSKKLVLTENEAREWRRTNFYRVSQLQNIPYIITGHTETDILEKNLNNIFRGTGLGGFSAGRLLTPTKTTNIFFFRIINSMKWDQLTSNDFKIKLKKKTKLFGKFLKTKKSTFLFLPNKYLKLKKKARFHRPKMQFDSLKNLVPKTFPPTKFWPKKYTEPVTPSLSFFPGKNLSYSFCLSNDFFYLKGFFFKPLERTPRVTVSKLMNFYSLPLIVDITNFSLTFSRNKIRHNLIPFSHFFFHRNSESLLIHFFQIIEFESDYREKKFKEFFCLVQFLIFKNEKQRVQFGSYLQKKKMDPVALNKKHYLLQKFFFEAKNINLTFFQLVNITKWLLK
jgi:tRNA(Ile)-lysidine synthase TilS/MesJ